MLSLRSAAELFMSHWTLSCDEVGIHRKFASPPGVVATLPEGWMVTVREHKD